jgi:hypothetical protein
MMSFDFLWIKDFGVKHEIMKIKAFLVKLFDNNQDSDFGSKQVRVILMIDNELGLHLWFLIMGSLVFI